MKSTNIVYETDASQAKGSVKKVIIPKNINEVILAVKNNPRIAIRGAGTGLAGGCVPLEHGKENDVVIDMSKLNKIISFNKARKSVEVEAGIILDELNDSLTNYGLEFPVNPSSHEVCTIGGMIATDAVGSRAGKYGRTSKWVEWIEVVDGEGNLKRIGKTDLSEFSGMEGITGIIVKASLRLDDKLIRTASLISLESLDDIVELVKELKRDPAVSMIEFFDKTVSHFIDLGRTFHILVEYESDAGKFKGKDYERVLALRDKVYPVLAQKGFCRIEDPKIFIERFKDLAEWLGANHVPVFGHLSVGILHPCFSKEQEKLIPEMIKLVKKFGGSVSGEHGIGILKKQFLEVSDKNLFEIVKKRNDPQNKFNCGKVLDL